MYVSRALIGESTLKSPQKLARNDGLTWTIFQYVFSSKTQMSAYKMCPRTTSFHLIAFSVLWQMQYRDENSVFLHKYLDNNNPYHKEGLILIPIAWVTRVRGKNFFFQIPIVKYRTHPVDYQGPSYIASSKSLILIFSSVHINRFLFIFRPLLAWCTA